MPTTSVNSVPEKSESSSFSRDKEKLLATAVPCSAQDELPSQPPGGEIWLGHRAGSGEQASPDLSEPEGCAKELGSNGLCPALLRSCYSTRPSASAPRLHPAFLGALNTRHFLQEPRVDRRADPHDC